MKAYSTRHTETAAIARKSSAILLGLILCALSLCSCGGGRTQNSSPAAAVAQLQITTATLPTGTVGQSYSAQLSATGGVPPYTWSIVLGQLAPGLSLNSSTGAISGTPTQAGNFSFTAHVGDSSLLQQQTAVASLTGTIQAPPLTITLKSLPAATVGQAYAVQLAASGGTPPYTWSITEGTLPPGLALNSSTGQIAGTPTQAGTFTFTVQVADSLAPALSTALIICRMQAA